MTFSDEATSRPVPGHGERMATRVAFFVVGVGYSMWAALVPYAKVRLGLDEATLGLLLLCIGLGSLLAMPFTGPLTGRFGCRRLCVPPGHSGGSAPFGDARIAVGYGRLPARLRGCRGYGGCGPEHSGGLRGTGVRARAHVRLPRIL